MKNFLILVFLVLPSLCFAEAAKNKVLVWNFFTGQSFLDIAEKNPAAVGLEDLYVKGLSDTMNYIAANSPEYAWVVNCSMQRQGRQLSEIFKKWLRKHPERWHETAIALYLEALKESCK